MNDFDKKSHDAEQILDSVNVESAQHHSFLKADLVAVDDILSTELIIKQVLQDLLPYIASHGGSVEFVALRDAIVYIKFSGTCVQCPLSFYTVTYGIERHIKAKVPWVIRVEVVEE